jgi:excisionase family DNA binding protein
MVLLLNVFVRVLVNPGGPHSRHRPGHHGRVTTDPDAVRNSVLVGMPDHCKQLPMLLPVPYAAKLLGISRSAAYRLAISNELPVRRLGGRVYVVTAKLFELVEAEVA